MYTWLSTVLDNTLLIPKGKIEMWWHKKYKYSINIKGIKMTL